VHALSDGIKSAAVECRPSPPGGAATAVLVAAAACLIFALLGWSAYYARGASALQVGKQTLDQKIQSLRRFQVQLDAIRKDAVVLDQVATPLVDAVNARSFWPQLLEDLNARVPRENIWITELFPLSAGKPFAPDAAQIASEGEQAAQTPGRPRSPFGAPSVDCSCAVCISATRASRRLSLIISAISSARDFSRSIRTIKRGS